MTQDRPLERKRARRGLGARSADGNTTPAKPRGRMKGAPGGSRHTQAAGSPPDAQGGRPRASRGQQGRRRTVRDNAHGKV